MTNTYTSGTEISFRLKVQGWTQAALAKKLGVSAGLVNNVVHNRVTSHEIAKHIAMLLEEPMDALWPGRYQYKPRTRHKLERKENATQ